MIDWASFQRLDPIEKSSQNTFSHLTALNENVCWAQTFSFVQRDPLYKIPFPYTIVYHHTYPESCPAIPQSLLFLTINELHCAKKPSRIKQIISFGMAPCIFQELSRCSGLLHETKPNPPICKLERKSTTQTVIWFSIECFAQYLRSILDKSKLSAKYLRGKRRFLFCCLNTVINQDDKIAWHRCSQRNELCI